MSVKRVGRDFVTGAFFWLWMIPIAIVASILSVIIYSGAALSGSTTIFLYTTLVLSVILFIVSIWYQGYIIRTKFRGRH